MKTKILLLSTLGLALLGMAAQAKWENVAGEWDPYIQQHPDTFPHAWFKSVRSKNGVPCCDISDGHPTEAERREVTDEQRRNQMSEWWVKIEGEWQQVPTSALVPNAANPVGVPTVWWVRQAPGQAHIRCFVPENDV